MLYHLTIYSIYVSSLQVLAHSGEVPPTCATNQECSQSSELSERGEIFCCGKCGNSFCCGNETLQITSGDCRTDDINDGDLNSSAKMLGVIIGGMVLSFSGAMIIHALIRKFIQARRKRRNRDGENGMPMNETPRQYQSTSVHVEFEEDLPSYEDIFLYKRVMEQVHNTASRHDGASSSANSNVKIDESINSDSKSNSSSPPPPYTISSRLQARYLDGPNISMTASDDNKTIPSQPTSTSSSSEQDSTTHLSANQSSHAGPSSDILIVQVIDMLKKLESDDNSDNARKAIKSAKNFLKEVVERGDTPKTHSRSSTSCGNVYESYELITAEQTPPQQSDQDDTRSHDAQGWQP